MRTTLTRAATRTLAALTLAGSLLLAPAGLPGAHLSANSGCRITNVWKPKVVPYPGGGGAWIQATASFAGCSHTYGVSLKYWYGGQTIGNVRHGWNTLAHGYTSALVDCDQLHLTHGFWFVSRANAGKTVRYSRQSYLRC